MTTQQTTDNNDKAIQTKEFLANEVNKLDPNLHEKLHIIFRAHDQLFDLLAIINDGFSLQMVVATTFIFGLLIFGLFFEIKVVAWAPQLVLMSSSYLLWSVISTIMVYLLLFICTTTLECAHESGRIVHKILQQKPAFMMTNDIYYSKMKAFNQQLLHRRSMLHFTALGLFRLDYSFIFSVRQEQD